MRSLICLYCGKMTSRNNKGCNPNPSIHIHGGVAHLKCWENRPHNTYHKRKEIVNKTMSIVKTRQFHEKIRQELVTTTVSTPQNNRINNNN